MTVAETLVKFIVQLRADGRSEHTCAQYSRHVRRLASWLASEGLSNRIDSLGHEDIARFLTSDAARLRPDGSSKKPTSMNALRSSIRVFFRYCHDCGLVVQNPARLTRRARCEPPPPRAITRDEERRLFEVLEQGTTFETRRDHALFRMMLGTGLRLSSALALRVEDIDLSAREVEIRSSKGNRPDRLPISIEVARVLEDWIGDRSEGVLFASRSGSPLCPRHVQRRFRFAVEKAGIRGNPSPHCLRHSFAMSLYSRSGGDIALVQSALRHRSIVSTLVYTRVGQQKLRAAIG